MWCTCTTTLFSTKTTLPPPPPTLHLHFKSVICPSSAPLVSSAVGDNSTSYRRFEDSTSDESSGSSFSKSLSPEEKGGEGEGESAWEEGDEGDGELPYHTIVIDCAPIGFADSMGITVLEQVM